MQEPNEDQKTKWVITKNLDVRGFIKYYEERKKEPPTEEQALETLHRARVFLADNDYMDKRLGRDSKRWLEQRGLYDATRRPH